MASPFDRLNAAIALRTGRAAEKDLICFEFQCIILNIQKWDLEDLYEPGACFPPVRVHTGGTIVFLKGLRCCLLTLKEGDP